MTRLHRLATGAILAGLVPALMTCSSPTPPASTTGGTTGGGLSTLPGQTTSPLLCRLNKPDGSRCVTLQQLPMQPAPTDQGYATQLTWVLTNECSYPMLVSWGWTEGQTVGDAVLTQGQSTQVSCLWNVDGCTGAIDWVYRCSQTR